MMQNTQRTSLEQGERVGARYALIVPRQAGAAGAGARLGMRPGHSVDFRDYREYQPGDDLRWVDWHVYARTDRLVVKLFHEEVSPHLDLIVDGSRSMALAGSAKQACTLGLAAVFATAAANAQCSWRVQIATDGVLELPGGTLAPHSWDTIDFTADRPFSLALEQRPPRLRPGSVRVVLSDLLWPGDPRSVLRRLADRAAQVIIVQVLGREDIEPPERGNTRLVDVETGNILELFVDAAAEERYRVALARHRRDWDAACREMGARFVVLVAETVVATPWNIAPLERARILEAAKTGPR